MKRLEPFTIADMNRGLHRVGDIETRWELRTPHHLACGQTGRWEYLVDICLLSCTFNSPT